MTCNNCGTALLEGEQICPVCGAAQAEPPAVQAIPLSTEKPKTQQVPIITWILLGIAILGIIFSLYTIISTQTLRGQLRRANADKAAGEATIADLETTISGLNTQLSDALAENKDLTDQITTLNTSVSSLQTDVNQYTYDKETAERELENATGEIDTLNETITGLETTLAGVQSELETAQTEKEALQSDYDTLQASYTALETEKAEADKSLSFYDQYVVFVSLTVKDGYYHKYGCSDFSTTRFYAYSPNLAEANSYSPCPKCCGDRITTPAFGVDEDEDNGNEDQTNPSPSPSPAPSASPSSGFSDWFNSLLQ